MTIKYHWDIVQNTDDWYEARRGLLTASSMKSIITATLRPANNDGSRSLVYEKIAERVTGFVEDTYQSWDMERGHIEETYAKELYMAHVEPVKDCGFITNDKWGFTLGFSPDALVADDGFIECKSHKNKIQVKTILENYIPVYDVLQVQTGFLVSERKWCDYISYSNGMPLFIHRMYPDEEIMTALQEAAARFEEKVFHEMETYNSLTEKMLKAPRRDYESGDEIKPSS